MLQVIAVLSNCPNHAEAALQVLYSGIRQDHSESVTVYLERVRAIAEDAYGPATRWTVNQASLVITKIVNGLKNRDLAQLTSSYIISLPFNFTVFRDFVAQDEQQIPTQSSSVHAITNLRCYRCEGNHLLCDCRKLKCMK